MYAIIVYDVDISRNRAILTYLRTHLNWIQNSVFEGELTEAEFGEVKAELKDLAEEQDSIMIYALDSDQYMDKSVIGEERGSTDRLL